MQLGFLPRFNSMWSQVGSLVGTGYSGTPEQGYSVALNSSATTLAVGGPYDNSNLGTTWIFTNNNGTWTQYRFKNS